MACSSEAGFGAELERALLTLACLLMEGPRRPSGLHLLGATESTAPSSPWSLARLQPVLRVHGAWGWGHSRVPGDTHRMPVAASLHRTWLRATVTTGSCAALAHWGLFQAHTWSSSVFTKCR